MQIELRRITDIKPYPGNPRINAEAIPAVAKSLKTFGFRNPILLDADGVIVAGHTRFAAANSIGLTEVPTVTITDLTPEQIRAFRIADNQTASLSDWDLDQLNCELTSLQDDDFDLDLLGFTPDELLQLIKPAGISGQTEPDVLPTPGGKAISQPGEIYMLGKHRLFCGEISPKAIQTLFNKDKATLFLTRIHLDNTVDKPQSVGNLTSQFKRVSSVMNPGAAFYLWYTDSDSVLLRAACEAANWQVRQGLVWMQENPDASDLPYKVAHLACLYGWLEGNGHLWMSDRKQSTVLEYPSENDAIPTALFAYLIQNSCPPHVIILDISADTGTTIIAAEQTGRCAYLIENSPYKCDLIRQRWSEFVHGKGCDWIAQTPVTAT